MSRSLPAPRDLPSFTPPPFSRTRLANGLDVIHVRKRNLPIFDLQVIVRGGGTIDPVTRAGRASMAAEMLDEGTRQRGALQISTLVEQLGADLDVRAGWDACLFSMHALTARFHDALDLVTELVLQPAFPSDEYERKHEERIHALQQEKDEPRTVALKALARAIFGDAHPFGLPLGGTLATVSALTNGDVRDYYQATFAPQTAHIVLVGDLEETVALKAIEQRLGSWPSQPAPAPAMVPVAAVTRGPSVYLIDRPGAQQSEVRFGHAGVPRSTVDYFPLIVMNTILGGSFKSRLNMKLREEKGFTYGASSFYSFRRAGGTFSGGAAVFTDATAETVALSVAEIERMASGDVSTDELQRARNYLSLGLMRNFETTGDIAGHLAEVALYDLPAEHLASYAASVAAVTPEAVSAAARHHLRPAELSVVVVGDRARVLPGLQALEFGPIHEWEAE